MLDTAIRELREELGLLIDRANVLAELPVVETRTTGYRVFPYLARIEVPNRWQVAEREIAEIIDVKLSELLRPDGHAKTIERFRTWQEPQQVSFYQVGSHRVWGAFLSHLASGHSAAYGGRVGRMSRRKAFVGKA